MKIGDKTDQTDQHNNKTIRTRTDGEQVRQQPKRDQTRIPTDQTHDTDPSQTRDPTQHPLQAKDTSNITLSTDPRHHSAVISTVRTDLTSLVTSQPVTPSRHSRGPAGHATAGCTREQSAPTQKVKVGSAGSCYPGCTILTGTDAQ